MNPIKSKPCSISGKRLVSVRVQKQDTEAMEKVIRRKIDPPPEMLPQTQPSLEPVEQPAQAPAKRRRKFSIFSERMEDGDVVTYRKHIYVLFTKTWVQILLGIGIFS